MTNRAITAAMLFATVLAISCRDLPTDATSTVEQSGGTLSFAGPENLEKFWDDSLEINIAIAGGSDQSLLESAASIAANKWNSHVLTNFAALPRFDQVGGAGLSKPRILITYDVSEYDNGPLGPFGYCGATSGGSGSGQNQERLITIYKKDDGDTCFGRIVDDLAGVIAHEFSEALGVKSVDHPETVWCVANVQDTGEILNKEPCAWEQQLVYQGYGVRTDMGDSPQFEEQIVRSLHIQGGLSEDTVTAGDTLLITAVAYSGPEPSQPAPRDSTAIEVDATWSLSNSLKVKIISQTDSTALITVGAQTGQSYLFIEALAHRNNVFPWPKDSILIVNPAAITSDFCIDDWTTTWKTTDQYLNAACGEKGTNIRYRWQFVSGGPWTAFTADTILDFHGHTTVDTNTVTLETKNIVTADTAQKGRDIVVSNNVLTMSGPDAILEKTLRIYTSSGSPCWFDRYPPQYNWLWLGVCQNLITWIWPAGGDYPAIMRTEKANDHGRAHIDVEVCTVSQSCGGGGIDIVFDMPGAEPTLLEEWGLFGLGPWMTAGSRGARKSYFVFTTSPGYQNRIVHSRRQTG